MSAAAVQPLPVTGTLALSALAYARRGWPVHPLKPGTKLPATEHGSKDATTDESTVIEWWRRWPDANIGIATGHRFWVLDVDTKHADAAAWLESVELPETVTQITGTRGRHYLYALPGFDVHNSQSKVGPHIDVRGVGGYIVAAPSIHPETRRQYAWDTETDIPTEEPAAAPGWLLEKLRPTNTGNQPFAVPPAIKHGVQHETLFKLACSMRAKGLEEPEIAAAVILVSKRCEVVPPEKNVVKIVADACKRYAPGPSPEFDWKVASPAEVIEGVDHVNVAEMPRHAKASQRPQLQPVKTVTGLEILKKEFPPPVFLFEGLLHNGVTLLCGRPKVGKSWLALQLAIDAACGRPAMTKFQNFGHAGVLYAALEEPESRTNARLKKFIGPELEVYADNIRFLYQLEPLSRGGIAQLDQALTLVPTRLLIVDTFMAAQRTERKANADIFAQDYNAVKELQNLAYKHEIALVMVHHTRKQSSDNPLDEVAGTTGITAGADSIWVLRKTAQGIILSIQGRDMADREIELGFSEDPDFFGWSVRAQGAEVGLSDARREILDVLRGPPLSPKEIAQCFPNKSEKTIRCLLDRMVKAGSIVRAGAKYAAEPVPFEVTQ